MLKRIVNSPYAFWLLLALPGLSIVKDALTLRLNFSALLYESGEWSVYFMVLALAVTPLRMLFKGRYWPSWLMKRRRYLGVAAFSYALLHFLIFLAREGDLAFIFADIEQTWMWTGWLALILLIPLAVTSNDWSIRKLGPYWRRLQQLAYFCVILSFTHWILHRYNFGPALVPLVPLILLEAYRLRPMIAKWWPASQAREPAA